MSSSTVRREGSSLQRIRCHERMERGSMGGRGEYGGQCRNIIKANPVTDHVLSSKDAQSFQYKVSTSPPSHTAHPRGAFQSPVSSSLQLTNLSPRPPVPTSPRPPVPTSPRPPVPPFPWQAQLTLLVAVHVFALQPLGELRGKADVVGRGEVEKELLGVVRDVEGADEGLHPFLV